MDRGVREGALAGADGGPGRQIRTISDFGLWQLRKASQQALVEYTRGRLARQLAASGAPPEEVDGRVAAASIPTC